MFPESDSESEVRPPTFETTACASGVSMIAVAVFERHMDKPAVVMQKPPVCVCVGVRVFVCVYGRTILRLPCSRDTWTSLQW